MLTNKFESANSVNTQSIYFVVSGQEVSFDSFDRIGIWWACFALIFKDYDNGTVFNVDSSRDSSLSEFIFPPSIEWSKVSKSWRPSYEMYSSRESLI